MAFHFCPQCGSKLQPDFQFCPSCGKKLPSDHTPEPMDTGTSLSVCMVKGDKTAMLVEKTSPPTSSITVEDAGSRVCSSSALISTRPPLRNTRNSLRLVQREKTPTKVHTLLSAPSLTSAAGEEVVVVNQVSPLNAVAFKLRDETEHSLNRAITRSPAEDKGKAKRPKRTQAARQFEEEKKLTDSTEAGDSFCSPVSSPTSSSFCWSPIVKGKTKKAKRVSSVKPLVEGEEVTDTRGRKWRLAKLLTQSTSELIYEVSSSSSKDSSHILKLAAKDGKIFNEQNFLQRAAKPSTVDKWIKQTKVDFLGIPLCVGFGLHSDAYRFLIFPDMGQSLQSIMEEREEPLSEKAILQIGLRILDVLEYIHSNEYVHADIHAENVYIKPGEKSQVYLVGFSHAFRYCPGGQHVEYHEASRTQHEGAIEFISLESHKGAGPSRRSDLQSLGYCMLHWHTGTLPWTALNTPDQVASEKQRYTENVPALLKHCFGQKKASKALNAYLTEVTALQYCDHPDYTALKAGLREALHLLGGSLQQPLSL